MVLNLAPVSATQASSINEGAGRWAGREGRREEEGKPRAGVKGEEGEEGRDEKRRSGFCGLCESSLYMCSIKPDIVVVGYGRMHCGYRGGGVCANSRWAQ